MHTLLCSPEYLFGNLKHHRLQLYTFTMILALVGSFLATIQILSGYFKTRYKNLSPYINSFLTFSLLTVSMIVPNPFSSPYYLGIGTPNPWHNPTYMFCRPFSLLVFIYLINSYHKHQAKTSFAKDLVLVAIFSLLSMSAKPSFLISFLPAVCIVFVILLIKKEVSIKYIIGVGLSLLPALIPLLLLNSAVYGSPQANGKVILNPGGVWQTSRYGIPLSIVLGMAFPLYVFAIKIKKLPLSFILAFVNYVIASLVFYFLAESGERYIHGNFGWTYMFGMFFMFFVSMEEFFLKHRYGKAVSSVGWGLFLLHFLSGLFYLTWIGFGHSYY